MSNHHQISNIKPNKIKHKNILKIIPLRSMETMHQPYQNLLPLSSTIHTKYFTPPSLPKKTLKHHYVYFACVD